MTCRNGRRWSVNEAYLKPVRERDNLDVETGAFATRIVVEGERATGVTYRLGGREVTANATREVLLCGGAVNSPQLLMLSGIGPGAHLREHGIDVVADLAGVGQRLQDHPAVPMIWYTRGTTDLAEFSNVRNLLRWKARGTGPLSSNVGEGGGFLKTREDLPAPDMQYHVAPAGFYDNGLREPTRRMFTAAPTLVSVRSRGSLRLRSADPDLATGDRRGVLRRRGRPRRDARRHEAAVGDVRPGAAGPLPRRALAAAREPRSTTTSWSTSATNAQTLYHPVATCAMGSGEDAVVDADLRVRGVGRAPRRGRLGHAGSAPGQHQRTDHHGCREGS